MPRQMSRVRIPSPAPIFYKAPSPSGKARVCKTLIPSSILGGASKNRTSKEVLFCCLARKPRRDSLAPRRKTSGSACDPRRVRCVARRAKRRLSRLPLQMCVPRHLRGIVRLFVAGHTFNKAPSPSGKARCLANPYPQFDSGWCLQKISTFWSGFFISNTPRGFDYHSNGVSYHTTALSLTIYHTVSQKHISDN